MSQENVEIVRRSTAGGNQRDLTTYSKITCLRLFDELDEALEAVGLSE